MSRLGEAALDAAQETGEETGGLPRRRVRVAGLEEETSAQIWMRLQTGTDYGIPYSPDEPRVRVIRRSGRKLYEVRYPDGSVEYRDTPPAAEPDTDGRLLEEALRENGYPVDSGDYCIPLGETACLSRDDTATGSDVEIMQVTPVRFLEPEGTKLAHLRPGYLYVYVDGHLWRELKVDTETNHDLRDIGSWMFYDVDLARYQGWDVRPYSRDGGQRGIIALPRKIAGETPKVEVAYSEVQWSWEYICRLGGMAEDDPRYLADYAPNRRFAGIAVDENLRKSRLQSIDLAGYVESDKSPEQIRKGYLLPVSQAHRENNPESDNTLSTQLKQTLPFFLPPYNGSDFAIANAKLPVLVLHDPLGVADELYSRFAYEYLRYADWMEEYGTEGKPESGGTGETASGLKYARPPASRYKKVMLARYVTAIVDANPSLKEKELVDHESARRELEYFETERKKREAELETRAGEVVAFLEGDGGAPTLPLPPESLAAGLLDYGLEPGRTWQIAGSERGGEGMQRYADWLQWLNQTSVGHEFLVRQMETEDSLTRLVFQAVQTPELQAALEDEAGGNDANQPRCHPGEPPASDAWLAQIRDAYGVTKTVWTAFIDLVELLARPWRVAMAGRRAMLVGRSGSAQGEFARILRILTLLYGEEVTLTAMSRERLRAAMRIREAGVSGPQILNIPVKIPNAETKVHVITIRDEPVLSRRIERILVDGYPARLVMALQALSIAIAWEEVAERGLGSELEVLEMLQLAFETINTVASLGQMVYGLSANREAVLARNSLRFGKTVGTGRLANALMAGKVLGGIAIIGGIGASAIGMIRDRELAREAENSGIDAVAKGYRQSEALNEYSVISGIVGLGAVLLAPVAAIASILVLAVVTVVEVGIFFKQLILQDEIERIRPDSPLEYWLHGCYWGTDPYGIKDIAESGNIDYALMKENFALELEVLQQILFEFRVRLSWIKGKSNYIVGGQPKQIYEPQLCLDILTPNPGSKDARVFLRFYVDRKSGPRKTLLAQAISLEPQQSGQTDWPRDVRLFRLGGQARAVYEFDKKPESEAGKTLRLVVKLESLPTDANYVGAEIVYDPTGAMKPMIPDGEYGVTVGALGTQEVTSRRPVVEEMMDSLAVYRSKAKVLAES